MRDGRFEPQHLLDHIRPSQAPVERGGQLIRVGEQQIYRLVDEIDRCLVTGIDRQMPGLIQELVGYRRANPAEDMTSTLISHADDPGRDFGMEERVGTLEERKVAADLPVPESRPVPPRIFGNLGAGEDFHEHGRVGHRPRRHPAREHNR